MSARKETYRAEVSSRAPQSRTLWEEGQKPGRLVASAAALLVLAAVLIDLVAFDDLTLVFDIAFVLACVVAAFAVRPRDFFVIGVYPPLLMAGTVALLAALRPGAVAEPADGFLQALVSGLAHHSGFLVLGYALTLGILALRQVALRNAGAIRPGGRPQIPLSGTRITEPRKEPEPGRRQASGGLDGLDYPRAAARMSRRSSGGNANTKDSSAV